MKPWRIFTVWLVSLGIMAGPGTAVANAICPSDMAENACCGESSGVTDCGVSCGEEHASRRSATAAIPIRILLFQSHPVSAIPSVWYGTKAVLVTGISPLPSRHGPDAVLVDRHLFNCTLRI